MPLNCSDPRSHPRALMTSTHYFTSVCYSICFCIAFIGNGIMFLILVRFVTLLVFSRAISKSKHYSLSDALRGVLHGLGWDSHFFLDLFFLYLEINVLILNTGIHLRAVQRQILLLLTLIFSRPSWVSCNFVSFMLHSIWGFFVSHFHAFLYIYMYANKNALWARHVHLSVRLSAARPFQPPNRL